MKTALCDSLVAVATWIVLVLLFAVIAPVMAGGGNGNGNFGGNQPPPNLCNAYQTYDVVVVGAGWSGIVSAKLLKEYQATHSGFKFIVLEMLDDWKWNGRGGYARYLMGGAENPIAKKLAEYFPDWKQRRKTFSIINVFDENVASYFDGSQEVTDALKDDGTFVAFGEAYQCLIDYTDNTLFDAAGGTKDESMRDALENRCNWPTPQSDDDILRSVEYAIDYEFSSTPDIMGLYNFPADRPNLDYGGADWFLTSPYNEYASSAQIAVDFVKADPSVEDNIVSGTQNGEVTKIYWDRDDGTDFPVKVRTKASTDGVCYNFGTKKLIFTPSAGVLARRGDCLHVEGSSWEEGCDPATTSLPLFDPVVPFIKMEATRRLYIDSNRSLDFAGMADYVELIFQFDSSTTFFNGYAKDFLIFNKKCRFWQNHNHRFYEGSKALVCTLNSEEWDTNADPLTKDLPDIKVRDLYNNSLGMLPNAPNFDVSCGAMDSPWDWYPGNFAVIPTSKSCAYTYLPSSWRENQATPDFDYAYGAYVTWNVGKNLNTLDADFSDFVEPLASNGVDRVYISGTATCDRHQGWVHGAWYAGIRVTKQVLQSMDSSYMVPSEFEEDFCDVGPNNQY